MDEPIPLLQVVHVTDMHVCDDYHDKDVLRDSAARLWMREQLERRNLFGWHEGTLPHDETASVDFERFLKGWSRSPSQWFPASRDTGPETWLIDSGDATTFGDQGSMEAAHSRLERWRRILGPCRLLSVFGNHDAWPGTQPALLGGPGYAERIQAQQALLGSYRAWETSSWLQPLVTRPGAGVPRIECYGLNTVSFGLSDNVRATGRIAHSDLRRFCETVDQRDDIPSYRILVTHHPISFPYEPDELSTPVPTAPVMVLVDADDIARRLANDPKAEGTRRRPYVHLFLSGHTHLAMPGVALPNNLKECRQGQLARDRLQLVGGSLMLVRSDDDVRANRMPAVQTRSRDDYTAGGTFDASQQFQILRFSFDPALPRSLLLERRVLARLNNSTRGYATVPELSSSTYVSFSS